MIHQVVPSDWTWIARGTNALLSSSTVPPCTGVTKQLLFPLPTRRITNMRPGLLAADGSVTVGVDDETLQKTV